MGLRAARVFIPALMLVLAACYRPAGEAIEPTEPRGEPIASATSAPAQVDATEEAAQPAAGPIQGGLANASGSDNLPPITVIVPTRASTQPPSNSFTTSSTGIPGTTPTYITPGVPLGQVPEPTATPTGGALTSTPSGLVTPTGFASGDANCTYTVQPGDYLYRIATDHNIELDDLRAANPDLTGDAPILQVGQQLNLPCGTPQPGEEPAASQPTEPLPDVPEGGQLYTVQAGDTLVNIASRFGVSVDAIINANNMADPDRLDIGQQLVIPPSGG